MPDRGEQGVDDFSLVLHPFERSGDGVMDTDFVQHNLGGLLGRLDRVQRNESRSTQRHPECLPAFEHAGSSSVHFDSSLRFGSGVRVGGRRGRRGGCITHASKFPRHIVAATAEEHVRFHA